jgi:hypothetical protein
MLDPCPVTSRGTTTAADATARWRDCIDEHLALRWPNAIDRAACGRHVAAVLAARPLWTPGFGAKQFTLGRAYYTDLEEDREDAYFEGAEASDAIVRRAAPGLQETMLALAAAVVGARVHQRPGWCGPGVHVFPPRGEVSRRGGEVHFDTEGLTDAQVGRRAPALSMVLMLQPAEGGGGLRVWDRLYDGEDFPEKPSADVPVTQIAYEPGELVVFDSYRLHQILPFRGARERISATVHVCFDGGWEAWF